MSTTGDIIRSLDPDKVDEVALEVIAQMVEEIEKSKEAAEKRASVPIAIVLWLLAIVNLHMLMYSSDSGLFNMLATVLCTVGAVLNTMEWK